MLKVLCSFYETEKKLGVGQRFFASDRGKMKTKSASKKKTGSHSYRQKRETQGVTLIT